MIASGQMCFYDNTINTTWDVDENISYNFLNGKIIPRKNIQDDNNIIAFPVMEKSVIKPLDNNIISLTAAKRNKDGSVCKTHCNKQHGISSEVYSFKTIEEIDKVMDVFNRRIDAAPTKLKRQQAIRNKLLFKLGINLGIRASDLRTLRWNYFFEIKDNELVFKQYYSLKSKKQRKYIKLFFNNTVKESLMEYLSLYPFEDFCEETLEGFVFPSQKPSRKKDKIADGDIAISEATMWETIKVAAKEAGIKQNIGSHSLRKTWGFWVWHDAEDKDKMLVILQHCFSHSSTQTTMRYIGLLDTEIKDAYESIELGNEGIEFCD